MDSETEVFSEVCMTYSGACDVRAGKDRLGFQARHGGRAQRCCIRRSLDTRPFRFDSFADNFILPRVTWLRNEAWTVDCLLACMHMRRPFGSTRLHGSTGARGKTMIPPTLDGFAGTDARYAAGWQFCRLCGQQHHRWLMGMERPAGVGVSVAHGTECEASVQVCQVPSLTAVILIVVPCASKPGCFSRAGAGEVFSQDLRRHPGKGRYPEHGVVRSLLDTNRIRNLLLGNL